MYSDEIHRKKQRKIIFNVTMWMQDEAQEN